MMTPHYQANSAPQAVTHWAFKPLTEAELPSEKLVAIPPDVQVPAEGYFTLAEVMQSGVALSIALSKGIVRNDRLVFSMSADGTLFYVIFHVVSIDDFNGALHFHIPGEAFNWTAGRTLQFAYNVLRGETLVMLSRSVAVPVRA